MSLFVRSAMKGFARSPKCNPQWIATNPELNARQKCVAEKLSFKADDEFIKSHKRIAAKVVTDRPRGERYSRYVTASVVWALSK